MNYTVRDSGLQLDQPPAIGNISSLFVVIQQNDNTEGVLEFRLDFINITGKKKASKKCSNRTDISHNDLHTQSKSSATQFSMC